jgi:pimeloyl-ACP methyl ester carboxylesterase
MSIACYSRVAFLHGDDVHWEEWRSRHVKGSEPRRPVVLLHGVSDSCRTWNKLAPELAASRRVYALDLPGHGHSGRPDASYDVRWYAAVVADWIRLLGLTDFDLIGHSLGGGIAMSMLIEPPGRAHRLGLVSPGGLGREVALPVRLAAVTGVVELAAPALMGVGTHVGMLLLGGNFDASERRHLARVNARPGTARALSRTLRRGADLRGQREHLMDHVDSIGELPPMAVYWGDRDPVIPVHHAAEVGRYLEGVAVRRFPKVGHYPHREATGALVPDLLRFLDDPQPTPRVRAGAHAAGQARGARSSRQQAAPGGASAAPGGASAAPGGASAARRAQLAAAG